MAQLVTYDEIAAGGPGQGGQTMKEIVLGDVVNLTSRRRPFMSLVGSGAAEALFFERLEDTLASRGHNAVQEGAGHTSPALSQPSRLAYIVQRFAKWGEVSDEQRDTAHYTEDPFTYQVAKKLEELLNDIEHAVIRGSAVTGTSSTARQLEGFINGHNTQSTWTSSSGTTLSEAKFIDRLQVFRDLNYAVDPDTVLVNSQLKRTISEYSTKVTRNVNASEKMQTLVVERHTSDFGDVDIVYSEDVPTATVVGNQGNTICIFQRAGYSVDWFKAPVVESLSRQGFSTRFQETAQCTLTYGSKKMGGGGDGFVANITT